MSSIKQSLASTIEALHIQHAATQQKLSDAIAEKSFHDDFLKETIAELNVSEILLKLLDMDIDFITSEAFASATESTVTKQIEMKLSRFRTREENLILHAPTYKRRIELFSIRRAIYWLQKTLDN